MAVRLVEIAAGEAGQAPGLDGLLDDAWRESGHTGQRPVVWRPYPVVGVSAAGLYRGRELLGYAVARPAPGMDVADFIYARPELPERPALQDRLIDWCERTFARSGLSAIVYAAYPFWRREAFPAALARAFGTRGYGSFRAVYFTHDLLQAPAPVPPPAGYRIVPFEDRRIEEAARMMLRSPEPEAIYWDYGLCCRSIAGAAAAGSPRFPDGLGQQILEGRGRLVAFSLATVLGYVNHVYTLPAHQGRGLATSAITHVLAAIRARGLRQASILTHETNPGAIRLYEALGFRRRFAYPQFHLRRGAAAIEPPPAQPSREAIRPER